MVERGIDGVHVHSAGLFAGGAPATEPAVRLLGEHGVDLDSHRSTTVTRELVEAADLVLGMTREHLREAVTLSSDAWPRTFTLRELVRRGEAHGARRTDEDLDKWLLEVGEGRRRADMLAASRADDIADPIGRPDKVYRRTIAELDDLIARFVALVFGGYGLG
jgi:protein-tyrosine phosphatase